MLDLKKLKEEYDALTQQLTDPELLSHWEKFQELSKRRALLEKILTKSDELEAVQKKIAENQQILGEEEGELGALAQEELKLYLERERGLKEEIEDLLKDEKTDVPGAVILEIRPGTGGEEAALFAADLFHMYTKYATKMGWKQTVLDLEETDLGGIKQVSVELQGKDVFEKLRQEGGVHRVQRIPATEKAGRIHTSTASVVILPKPKTAHLKINPSDLKIEFYNASGPGGQNVNKRQTAVRITHLPTKLVVSSQSSRNQQRNKEYALELLEAKLFQQEKEIEERKISGARRDQIGKAERAEKIRTYNFPQDRITDHRLNTSWHGIEHIMEGNLDPIIESFQEYQGTKTW